MTLAVISSAQMKTARLPAAPIFWTSATADMPGFRKEEIHIDIDGDRLTISAEHSQETKQENETYLRRERRFGSLSRSFDISAVSAQNITASYENGVLQLDLPKKSAQKPVAQRIEIR